MILPVVLPVFLTILVGFALRRSGFLDDPFWLAAERLAYFVLLPALLIVVCAGAKVEVGQSLAIGAAIAAGIGAITALCLLCRPALGDGARFTSVVQGAVRFNSYIGLAIASGLFGQRGLAVAAVAVPTIVICGNVVSVLALSVFGTKAAPSPSPSPSPGPSPGPGPGPSPGAVLRQCATNPLIVACALGVAVNLSGFALPAVLADLLELLGRAALPIGLLAVGAGLRLTLSREQAGALAVSSLLKLAALPLVTLGIGHALGLDDSVLAVTVLFNALPTASSAYILAWQLGGDAQVMASIITLQVVLALVSLPLILTLLS